MDMENRAYYMTIAIQRWLSIRLDLIGNSLVLGIGLFAAGFRHTVNPAKVGVVLSYTLASESVVIVMATTTLTSLTSNTDLLYAFPLPHSEQRVTN